jgi:hypothetical protein
MIGSGNNRLAPSGSVSRFEASSNNSRIGRATGSWPQTWFWESAPDKSASFYKCFPFIWLYSAQTVHLGRIRPRSWIPRKALVVIQP